MTRHRAALAGGCLVLAGALGLTGCNLRMGEPARQDPSAVTKAVEVANARLQRVAEAQNRLLSDADLGAGWSTLNPSEVLFGAYPMAALVACLGTTNDAVGNPYAGAKPRIHIPAPLALTGIDILSVSRLFRRDDLAYAGNLTLDMVDSAAAAKAFGKLDGTAYALCVAKLQTAVGTEAAASLDQDQDPAVSIATITFSHARTGGNAPYAARIVALVRGPRLSILLFAEPTETGQPDPRSLASLLWNRLQI
jgi:hypothetical protein